MRISPIALAAALALATIAGAGHGQAPVASVNPASVALVEQGESLMRAGDHEAAIDAIETALAVDPANGAAYVALARVAQSRQLPGKAIALYAEALKLAPNDVTALAGQGEALVQRGAIDRARRNLALLDTACAGECPQSAALAALIAKGPPVAVVAVQAPADEGAEN